MLRGVQLAVFRSGRLIGENGSMYCSVFWFG
jgi:hypothetical protein